MMTPDPEPSAEATPAARGFRVLVVDDSRPVAEIFAAILRDMGHQSQVAHNGEDALAAFPQHRPQIVFSDISMPGMTGYELAQQIRARSDGAEAVLVALTGYDQPEDRDKALRSGFDYHLVKPVELDQLQALLTTVAARVPPER